MTPATHPTGSLSAAISLPGQRHTLRLPGDQTAALYYLTQPDYETAPTWTTPLLAVHSVNATASAFEMEPVVIHQARQRPVVALDLPGFGASTKPDVPYSPLVMQQAVSAAMEWIADNVSKGPVDVMALSLSCEFAAEAVLQQPGRVRTLTLISPTGMEDRRVGERHEAGKTREAAWLRRLLRQTRAGRGLYRLLTTEPSVRWFLARSWGTRDFDPRLLEHGLRCATLPGAENAPLDFVAGALFTAGVIERYRALPVPLWVAHGKQGAFTDFGACPERCGTAATGGTYPVERTVFESGAMPHFQLPDDFNAAYERFISGQRLPAPQARRPRDGRPASMVGRLGVEPSTNGL